MILTDNETKVDLLNNEAIATTIIGLLSENPNHPVTIGVHGDWGAGKSSVLEMIESDLSKNDDILCLKFNGWRFQGFEDAKIALIEGIVSGLIEKRTLTKEAWVSIREVVKRVDLLKLAKRAGGLAFTAFTGIPTADQLNDAVGVFKNLVVDPTQVVTKENVSRAIDEVQAVMRPGESTNVPQEVEEFRKAFDQLLKDAGIKQLIVLIDDLDRCLPDTAIETLEAIRLFVFTSKTAFVVAADEAMIEYAVRKHFPDLPDSTGPRDYARNYLEKLIQIPFRIPALGEAETRIYVTLLLAGAFLGEEDDDYQALINVAREKLKRPWISGGIDASSIKTKLGSNPGKLNEAFALSEQVGPILASGAKGNPRQIKRFLNTLLLRDRTAVARGFGDDIKLPVLAKLMLAERFIPKIFDQIALLAATHPSGHCVDLGALEAYLASPPHPSTTKTDVKDTESTPSIDSLALSEWADSQHILDWVKLSPSLAGVDLRPYLFVTKDKKDYFGPVSTLGHLAGVVEKLFEGKFAVQGYESELKLLTVNEADKVFDAARSRIMSAGEFASLPSGIDGLIVLVKAQPSLQGKVVDFLESIPTAKCGPWVVSRWQGAITDTEQNTRLKQLIVAWSQVTNNLALSSAATQASKPLKGKS